MTYVEKNFIKIQELDASESEKLQFEESNGSAFYSAYKRNLNSSKTLAKNGHYHDAWLFLNLSVECFFKHVYLLLKPKFKLKRPPTKKFPLGPIEYDGLFLFYRKTRNKLPSPSEFNHEVMELYQLVALFTDASENSFFQELKSQIPTHAEWIEARYSLENNLAKKEQFEIYLNNFEGTLDTIFRNLK